jgi:hypothetical protein
MQGGSNFGFVVSQIRGNSVVLLTESGNPGFVNALAPPNAQGLRVGTVNFGSQSRPDERNIIHYPNGRCSMTVLVDTALGPIVPSVIPGPAATLRPMVGGTVNGLGIYVFHAPSGNHNAARGVLNHQFNALSAGAAPSFIAGGDGNSDLSLQTVNGVRMAYVPGGATHQSGGALDGFVASVGNDGTVENVGMTASDHCGVQWRSA